MFGSRRVRPRRIYKVDESDSSNVQDDEVGTEIVRAADKVLTVAQADDDRQPGRVILLEDAGLLGLVGGYNVPVDLLAEMVDTHVEFVFGFSIEDELETSGPVKIRDPEWHAQWFQAEDPDHWFERIRLLDEFGLDLHAPKQD